MAPEFLDIMIDTETSGTNPEINGLLQISAVKFDYKTRSVQPYTDFFDRCLRLPKNRYWEEGTREWWGKRPQVLRGIMARGEDPQVVMKDFFDWVGYQNSAPVRFWAKPTTFEWGYFASYARQFDLQTPFHYRWATDMNSFIRGMAGDPSVESHYVPFEGEAHNAIFDVLNQINCLFDAGTKYGNH